MTKKNRLIYLISSLLLCCLVGCAVQSAPPQSEQPATVEPVMTEEAQPAEPESEAASAQELIVAAPRDLTPGEKDPYYAHPMLEVWESLISTDDDWVPQPDLAESWELSDDGLTWTFHLRDDVLFSDGSPFNADAVVANVERFIQISPRRSPFYSLDKAIAYGDLDRVEKVDEYTVRFIHNTPDLFFVDKLANFYSAMFAPASFDENGDFKEFPIGSGPFQIVERVPDQYAILEPNPHYHGDQPPSSRVRVRTIPDPNTRASALRAGEIHAVLDLGVLPPPIAQELVQTGEFELSQSVIPITHYLYTNLSKAPWDDVRLRQAVNMVIDRERIAENIWLGYAIPAGSMLSSVVKKWHDPTIELPYDPEAAATLAKEVLGDERVTAKLIFSSSIADRGHPYKLTAEYIQTQLQPLGIDVEIQILEGNAYREAAAAGDYDLAMSTHGLANSEPTHIFRRIAACDGQTNQRMHLEYCNDEVEALLQESTTERDPDRQLEIAYELQAIAAQDLPAIPLFYDVGTVVTAKNVAGYQIKTNYWVTLDTAYLK